VVLFILLSSQGREEDGEDGKEEEEKGEEVEDEENDVDEAEEDRDKDDNGANGKSKTYKTRFSKARQPIMRILSLFDNIPRFSKHWSAAFV